MRKRRQTLRPRCPKKLPRGNRQTLYPQTLCFVTLPPNLSAITRMALARISAALPTGVESPTRSLNGPHARCSPPRQRRETSRQRGRDARQRHPRNRSNLYLPAAKWKAKNRRGLATLTFYCPRPSFGLIQRLRATTGGGQPYRVRPRTLLRNGPKKTAARNRTAVAKSYAGCFTWPPPCGQFRLCACPGTGRLPARWRWADARPCRRPRCWRRRACRRLLPRSPSGPARRRAGPR